MDNNVYHSLPAGSLKTSAVVNNPEKEISCWHSQRGFTLIELLIAVAVTAIIGISAARVLNSGVKTKEAVEVRAAVLEELQKSQRIIENDLSQIVSRTVRSEYGDRLYACTNLNALTLMEFSRTGWRDPRSFMALLNPETEIKPRSNLQRIVYELEDDVLYRVFWDVMDRSQDSEPRRQQVLTQVASIKLKFLDEKGKWSEQWPPNSLIDDEEVDAYRVLPKGIELLIEHDTFGEIRRLIQVAGWNAHRIEVAATDDSENSNSSEEEQTSRASGSQNATSQGTEQNNRNTPQEP